MATARVNQAVLEREDVLRQRHINRGLWAEAWDTGNINVADLVSTGHKRQQGSVDVCFNVLADVRAAEAEAERVEGSGRERLTILACEELVAREE